jgi:PAS domain S-box-containing protein
MSTLEIPPEVAALVETDEAVVVINHEGLVVAMSPAAEKLAGVSAEDLVGEFVEMLVPEKLRFGHQAYRRGYLAQPSPRDMDPGLEPHLERPDGTLVPIAVFLEPHRVGGKLFVSATIHERPAP